MRSLPPLASLRAFEAAARLLSFKAAADELHVTPTAISHQVRVLEAHCGQRLFDRSLRPLALTTAGAQLYPALRDGLDRFAEGVATVRGERPSKLRVTGTNAFTARCLMPRVPAWRAVAPDITLTLIGTDHVEDLSGGGCDVAIRYARTRPKDGVVREIVSDAFHVVCSPELIAGRTLPIPPAELATLPLIESEWPETADSPPMWPEFMRTARREGRDFPDLTRAVVCAYREELHAIEAAISGQGLAICSDVLVADALRDGRLVVVSELALPGYTFFSVFRREHPNAAACLRLVRWLHEQDWRAAVPPPGH
jgi:LysR family glycine cleavage system transcriptional activator